MKMALRCVASLLVFGLVSCGGGSSVDDASYISLILGKDVFRCTQGLKSFFDNAAFAFMAADDSQEIDVNLFVMIASKQAFDPNDELTDSSKIHIVLRSALPITVGNYGNDAASIAVRKDNVDYKGKAAVKITAIGDAGDYARGAFAAEVIDGDGAAKTITNGQFYLQIVPEEIARQLVVF